MKLLKWVLLGLLGMIALIILVGLFLPRTWRVEQSVTIAAPPAAIHPWVNSLRRWPEWVRDPAADPDVQETFTGPERGVDASWTWSGAQGHGEMRIVRSDPALGVWVEEKIEGDEVNAFGAMSYAPEGGGTRVTWTDEGTLPPVIGGYFRGVVERSLSEHFGKALERLKARIEAAAVAPDAAAVTPADERGAYDAGTDGATP